MQRELWHWLYCCMLNKILHQLTSLVSTCHESGSANARPSARISIIHLSVSGGTAGWPDLINKYPKSAIKTGPSRQRCPCVRARKHFQRWFNCFWYDTRSLPRAIQNWSTEFYCVRALSQSGWYLDRGHSRWVVVTTWQWHLSPWAGPTIPRPTCTISSFLKSKWRKSFSYW